MDSTSNLFSRLDIIKNSASPPLEDMDDMDIDLVEEDRTFSFNTGVGSRRKKHSHHGRDYGHRNFGSSSTGKDDTEQQHRRARLVELINNTLETTNSSQAQDKAVVSEQNRPCTDSPFEKNAKHPEFVIRHPRNNGTWKKKGKKQSPVCDGGDLVLKSGEKKERKEGNSFRSDSFRYDASRSNQGQRRMVHNGFYSHHNSVSSSAKNLSFAEADAQGTGDLVGENPCLSAMKHGNKDMMKGLISYPASQPRTGQGHQRWSQIASHPKNTGERRLLQNRSTSHYTGECNKNAANDSGVGTNMSGECLDGNSVHHIGSPGFESRHMCKDKGKMKMENSILGCGQDNRAKLHSGRLEVSMEISATADDNANIPIEDIVWRGKASVFPIEDSVYVSNIEEVTYVHISDPEHKIAMKYGDHVNPERTTNNSLNHSGILAPESETRSRECWRRQKFMKGKTDCNSICSNYCRCSSSTNDNTEMLHLQSSTHIPMSVDSQHYSDIFDPVIVLDELQSPVGRCNSLHEQIGNDPDNSSARISQVESDEMLARQLQEKFYEEVAGSANMDEIDATIAWSLQQEDTHIAASTARIAQPDNREASMAHLYEYYSQLHYRNSSARWSNHTGSRTSNRRRNYYSSEVELEARMMAEVRNFTGMDSRMRRNFLEELEAAFDHSNDALAESVLESYNDFNEYDYETLLALDENNHQHAGASERQINSLPQSVIQGDSVEEACAICLENPSFGETIRHLPCLHKFHQDCIDPWLRRRASCPVCKSDMLLHG